MELLSTCSTIEEYFLFSSVLFIHVQAHEEAHACGVTMDVNNAKLLYYMTIKCQILEVQDVTFILPVLQ